MKQHVIGRWASAVGLKRIKQRRGHAAAHHVEPAIAKRPACARNDDATAARLRHEGIAQRRKRITALLIVPRIFGPREPLPRGLSRTTLALTTTRRARKRPAESLCHPPSAPCGANEATTFAPRPRALKRPVLPPSRPPPDRAPDPIRRGSPPALRTAIWTCLRNGCVRGLIRAPRFRDRPGLIRKFSLSSRVMTRRLASEKADTRASEHRSHQIAPARMMAKK